MKQHSIRDLSHWKYFAWGFINGLFISASLRYNLDISESGIYSMVLNSFKPILQILNFSTTWITALLLLSGFLGVMLLIFEIIDIYRKGKIIRIIASLGFLSIFFLILGFDILGIILLIVGVVMVQIFST